MLISSQVRVLEPPDWLLLRADPGHDGGPPKRGARGPGPAHGQHHGEVPEIHPLPVSQGILNVQYLGSRIWLW